MRLNFQERSCKSSGTGASAITSPTVTLRLTWTRTTRRDRACRGSETAEKRPISRFWGASEERPGRIPRYYKERPRVVALGPTRVPRFGLTRPLAGARMGFVAKTQVHPFAEARDLVRCGEPNGGRACSLKTKQRKRE